MEDQLHTDEWLEANHRLLQVWTEQTQRWMTNVMSGNPAVMDHPPLFEDLMGMNRKFLTLGEAMTQVTREMTHYQAFIGPAFFDIWSRYVFDPRNHALDGRSVEAAWDNWLNYANGEILNLQNSDSYLEASQRMSRAVTQFNSAQRKISDYFLSRLNMPTQQEVDSLGRTLFELKREVRHVKEALKEINQTGNSIRPTPEQSAA